MASAVIKSGEHVGSEKLESISGASMSRLSISSAELSVNTKRRKVNSLSFEVNVRLLCQFDVSYL